MTIARKLIKFLLYFLILLILFFAIGWVLLQQPKVQTFVTQKITNKLSQSLSTKLSIESVNIEFFKTIALEGIYIEDQSTDTLLYAKALKADIGIFSLFSKKIILNEISLQGASIHLNKNKQDSLYNFDFLINAFQSEPSTEPSKNSPWVFGINKIAINQSQLFLIDEIGNSDLNVAIDNLTTDINRLDLDKQILDIKDVRLSDTQVDYFFSKKSTQKEVVISTTDKKLAIAFPEIPWQISVDRFQSIDNAIRYKSKGKGLSSKTFNPENIAINNINFLLQSLAWKTKNIDGNIQNFNFVESSGFALKNLQAKLHLDSTQLSIENLLVETQKSLFENTTKITFGEFNELIQLSEKTRVESLFKKSQIAASDLRLFIKDFQKTINLRTDQTINLDGKVAGTFQTLDLKNIHFQIPNQINLRADGNIKNIKNYPKTTFQFSALQLASSYKKINSLFPNIKLPPALATFGEMTLQSELQGSINDLQAKNVVFQTETNTYFKGNINLTGLPKIDDLRFNLDIKDIQTKAADWQPFVEQTFPAVLDSLGRISYQGQLTGDLHDFKLDGNIVSEIGQLNSDVQIQFNENYDEGNYSGKLMLKDFDLGIALSDTTIGKVTADLTGKGRGLKLDSLDANVDAIIKSVEWRNYQYQNLAIKGDFKQKKFNGSANFKDENAALEFQGLINLNDSIPEFQFEMDVDTLDFYALNLLNEPLGISLKTQMNFSGKTLDDLNGKLLITEFTLQDSLNRIKEDSLILSAELLNNNAKLLSFKSDFLAAQMKGDFDINLLGLAAKNFINDYFPMSIDSALIATNAMRLGKQKFTFDVELTDTRLLKFTPFPELSKIENATLNGEFSYQKQKLDIQGKVVQAVWQSYQADTLLINATGSARQINTQLSALNFKGAGIKVAQLVAQAKLTNDSLFLDLDAINESGGHQLTVGGVTSSNERDYIFNFDPQLIVNDDPWTITDQNKIYLSNQFFFVDEFALQKDNHLLTVQSQGNYPTEAVKPLELRFTDYNISEVFKIIGIDQDEFEGEINGYIKASNLLDKAFYEADLKVDSFSLNQEIIGQVVLKADLEPAQSKVNINAKLLGPQNNLNLAGNYLLEEKEFDIKGQIEALEMRLLNPFTIGIIKDSKGFLSGDIVLKGTTEKPILRSDLALKNISTNINFLNTRFTVPEHIIQIDEGKIALGKVDLLGVNDKTAVLSGNIQHRFFTDFKLGILFETDDFQLLNTTEKDNDIFWGNLNLKTDVNIQGTLDLPKIEINARTLANSNFYIQTLLKEDELAEIDYITFANPNVFDPEEAKLLEEELKMKNAAKLDLQMNLQVTPDANLELIIDPVSGDKVTCVGNANMTIRLNPSGVMTIFGDYVIDNGLYRFSYGQFIKKEFNIESGSQVSFYGDILDSRLDIKASYTTNAAPYELVSNELSVSETDVSSLQKRTPVSTYLLLKGDLAKPAITFDIQLPKTDANSLGSSVNRKLLEMRNDPAEMNKQVFSLLLFNNFFPSSNSNGSVINGENIALSSVSKLVSNQLNKLANKFIKGVEVSIDLDSYQSQGQLASEQSNVTDLQLGLSKKLFNDRLTVKAGADVGLTSSSNSSFTNIAGDFVLEYQLTESGNYLLKVFRRSDYDVLNDENTSRNGVSISAKKSFGGYKKNKKSKKTD